MVKHNTDTNGIGYEWEYAKVKDDRTIWQKIIMGIYNPSSHEFLGRSAKSWGNVDLTSCNGGNGWCARPTVCGRRRATENARRIRDAASVQYVSRALVFDLSYFTRAKGIPLGTPAGEG